MLVYLVCSPSDTVVLHTTLVPMPGGLTSLGVPLQLIDMATIFLVTLVTVTLLVQWSMRILPLPVLTPVGHSQVPSVSSPSCTMDSYTTPAPMMGDSEDPGAPQRMIIGVALEIGKIVILLPALWSNFGKKGSEGLQLEYFYYIFKIFVIYHYL